MGLTGADILAFDDRKVESIVVPEWGNTEVFVRTMGAVERAKYESSLLDLKDTDLETRMYVIKVTLVLLCACDEFMVRLFTSAQFDALAEKSATAIDRVFDVVDRLNLITQSGVDEEKGN